MEKMEKWSKFLWGKFMCIYIGLQFLILFIQENLNMKDSKNNKRNSVEPGTKIYKYIIQKIYGATEIQVKSIVQESQSKSIITNNNNLEQYSLEQLSTIFTAISKGKGSINCKDLYGLLEEQGYGDSLYNAVEMIALVDTTRKGFVTYQQFMVFFTAKIQNNEEKVPPLTVQMIKDREWIKAMQKNPQFFKNFQDKEYCEYVYQKIKKLKEEENH